MDFPPGLSLLNICKVVNLQPLALSFSIAQLVPYNYIVFFIVFLVLSLLAIITILIIDLASYSCSTEEVELSASRVEPSMMSRGGRRCCGKTVTGIAHEIHRVPSASVSGNFLTFAKLAHARNQALTLTHLG